MQKILLITGWGVGTKPLEAFKNNLIEHNFVVDLIDVFDAFESSTLEHYVQLAQKYDVLMGWSLGGQLATLLTKRVYEKFAETKTLITLASNPSFVANDDWNVGMPISTFLNFRDSFEKEPNMTIKRFCYLVTQGGTSAKQNWQWLLNSITRDEQLLKLKTLELLQSLNTVNILKNLGSEQIHFFADQDGLVDHKIVDNFRKLDAKFLKIESVSGSHGFPIFRSKWLSDKIVQYLDANEKS